MKTIKLIAKESLELQNACNVSGLLRTWSEWCPVIREHASQISVEFNHHPINKLMADKIQQLTGNCNYREGEGPDYKTLIPQVEAIANME